MRDYERLGHMTQIDNEYSNEDTYYLPHHAVLKESSLTTKVRVVFDASAKSDNGLSLNDIQFSSPTKQADLFSILLRFRQHPFVINGDVSKMYRQILIHKDQRKFQRIFWRENSYETMRCYELNTLTASAPFLAVRALFQLAIENEMKFPDAARVIKNDFYMDDLLTSSDSLEIIISIQRDVSVILLSAGLNLRKWLTNRPDLCDEFQFNNNEDMNLIQLGPDENNKTLGVFWNAKTDTIQYSFNQTHFDTVTKRSILSAISQIFDPLGLLGPVIVIAKLILQQLWQAGLTWDESIPQKLYSQWVKFREYLQLINQVKIPRFIRSVDSVCIEMHGYCDSSESAFGACVYIRSKDSTGIYTSRLLCAKSRVVPLKQIYLPKLELCGATLLAHLVKSVRVALDLRIHKNYFWCDSTITLGWIKAPARNWKTFVANRVGDIQTITDPSEWYHVKSAENPADLLTRGMGVRDIIESRLWWEGPSWLLIEENLFVLIRISQRQSFPSEYDQLFRSKPVDMKSCLLCLNPFLDQEFIIRVGGRLGNSEYDYSKKHPIVLSPNHKLTILILTDEHRKLFHCGPQQLLFSIRERYWPLCGRSIARKITRGCVTCFKVNPVSEKYMMGNLPDFRVTQNFPFTNVGIDYAGPILIKDRKLRGAKLIKAYICLFICMSTKAIHIDLVTDLSTEAFIATLRRFVARRGKPSISYSDNGTTFVGANSHIKELFSFFKDSAPYLVDTMSAENISWHFIPARSPNFGGLLEAGVKRIKYHMKRVVGNLHLTYEDFQTVLTQIECIINARPLTPLSSDPADFVPLTPAHFLIGKTMTAIPDPDLTYIKESRLSIFQRIQQANQHFWKRWHKDYISELQARVKWKVNSSTLLKIGSLVILKEDNQPPLKWKLGRVVSVHQGKDKVVRVATVRLSNGSEVQRTVSKLCVLPMESD